MDESRRKDGRIQVMVLGSGPGKAIRAALLARALEAGKVSLAPDFEMECMEPRGIQIKPHEGHIHKMTEPAVIEGNPHRPSRKLKGRNRRKW